MAHAHLGSPRYITSGSTGRIVGEQAFGPYGEQLVGTFNGKTLPSGYRPLTGYTGHLNEDLTGLVYMKGRYYSPLWHRFINSDQGVDPRSVNQFAYVGGSPFMAADPSGMAYRCVFRTDTHYTWVGGETGWREDWTETNVVFCWALGDSESGSRRHGDASGGGAGGGEAPSKTYSSVEDAIRCGFWHMLQDLESKNEGRALEQVLWGRHEYGGLIYSDGKGGFAHSDYVQWVPGGTGGVLASIPKPSGMIVIGNYHTHNLLAFFYKGNLLEHSGWSFSGTDLTRNHGASMSNSYYSSIVTPDIHNIALVGRVPPNRTYTESTQYPPTINIHGRGCQ